MQITYTREIHPLKGKINATPVGRTGQARHYAFHWEDVRGVKYTASHENGEKRTGWYIWRLDERVGEYGVAPLVGDFDLRAMAIEGSQPIDWQDFREEAETWPYKPSDLESRP